MKLIPHSRLVKELGVTLSSVWAEMLYFCHCAMLTPKSHPVSDWFRGGKQVSSYLPCICWQWPWLWVGSWARCVCQNCLEEAGSGGTRGMSVVKAGATPSEGHPQLPLHSGLCILAVLGVPSSPLNPQEGESTSLYQERLRKKRQMLYFRLSQEV